MNEPQAPYPAPYNDPWGPPTVPVSAGQPASAPPASGPPVSWPGDALVPVTAPYLGPEPVIAQIGEIQVTSTTVRTPAGQFPLRGSQWSVTDQWTTDQKIPTWAIVLAIVLFFCVGPFSLLFLLAKESINRGVVQVQVVNGHNQYVSRLSADNQQYVQHVYQQVNYVRSLASV
jgi:hypothetical protein